MTDRVVLTDGVPEPTADPGQVAELLAASRAAHQRYRDAVPHRGPNGVIEGNPSAAGIAVLAACRLLADAHALDPKHTDPNWRPEDGELLTFYSEQLSR